MNKAPFYFFHPNFSDGGVERTNLGLAKMLIEDGHSVCFISTQFTHHYHSEIANLGISTITFNTHRMLFCIPKLIKFINKTSIVNSGIYLICCQYYVNVLVLMGSFFFKQRNLVNVVCSERNHLEEFTTRTGIKSKIILLLVKKLYTYADYVIANSKETANDLETYTGRPVQCVYNPTINSRLDEKLEEPISESWFLRDNRVTIIAVGRLSRQKNFLYLIKAFHLIPSRSRFRLIILGDGPERANLEYQIQRLGLINSVLLPGFQKNPYKFMKASNLFVLCSKYEGLHNVLIEAMYAGLRCISTRCKSGPSEIFEYGKYGKLVDQGNPNSLASAIEDSLKSGPTTPTQKADLQKSLFRFTALSVHSQLNRALEL